MADQAARRKTSEGDMDRIDRRTLVKRGVGLGATAAAAGSLSPWRASYAQDEEEPLATPQPTVAPADNAVRLEYWDMAWGSSIFMARLQDNVTEFNLEHPEIHVSFTQLAWGDYSQKLLSAVQAGNPPDVGGGDSGIPFTMAAQDQALDISDLFEEWANDGTFDDMAPWAYEKWQDFRGIAPGITWQHDSRAIYYRKDLLEAAGVAVPTTWDEWRAAMEAVHDPTNGVMGLAVPGKQSTYDTDQFYMTLVFQAGGGLADEEGNLTIDTPEHLAALEFEKEIVENFAASGTPSWTFTEVMRAFEQEQAAFAFGGGWFIEDIRLNAPELFDRVGMLPPLIGPGGEEAQHIVSFANPWMIYKQTEHPEEAKTFLKWMMRKENLEKLYASEPGGKWPVYRSLIETPTYQSNDLLATMAEQTVEYGVDYWYPNTAAAVGIASVGTALSDIIVNPVITGNREPKAALEDAQENLEPLFQRPDD
ncbi:MAG TPA: sugar ABC transporter substrate-binding protein [Thermomicrobiales bacterium]|nr:sugar ABC transporter substrate-binding protein [Thermomicrobiales bacterium]